MAAQVAQEQKGSYATKADVRRSISTYARRPSPCVYRSVNLTMSSVASASIIVQPVSFVQPRAACARGMSGIQACALLNQRIMSVTPFLGIKKVRVTSIPATGSRNCTTATVFPPPLKIRRPKRHSISQFVWETFYGSVEVFVRTALELLM